MPGLCLLVCILALAVALWCSLRWQGDKGRLVLVVPPTVPLCRLEGALRVALADMQGMSPHVAVYAVADGERAALLGRLCAGLNVPLLQRAAALKLWQAANAEFWRLNADGGVTRLR